MKLASWSAPLVVDGCVIVLAGNPDKGNWRRGERLEDGIINGRGLGEEEMQMSQEHGTVL